ncbi:MAG TPA: methylenetetrahydrofolate reductase C-terminal domain-containing protein [Victivallales bacterium]|nr:methylenetetrahydrofolate reductase C-terminal domain-containing protein [Victivallales bacterium]
MELYNPSYIKAGELLLKDLDKKELWDFSGRLKSGDFFVLIEIPLPREKPEIPIYEAILNKMQLILSSKPGIKAGIAFTDHSDEKISDFGEFFSNLSEQTKDSSVIFLSGRGNNLQNIGQQLDSLKRLNIKNIVATTGETSGIRPSKPAQNKNTMKFVDSVHMAERISTFEGGGFFNCGAVVNPFKYSAEETYTQYYKLMKKFKCGASFAVVQAGWDMKKLQELRWFLEMRDFHAPMLARMMVLTPELSEDIFSGKYPGLIMSDDIKDLLLRESKYGYAQFASAQWRRLQIMTAGARLLGYSAVQIAGVERPEHAETVLAKIAESLDEFKSFDDWKVEYQNHLSRAEPAPFPHNYYMFDNLFQWQYPEGHLKIREARGCELSTLEKIKYKICSILFPKAHRQVPEEHYFSKKILVGCRGCAYCRVSLTHFVCPETCPKGLANGPCGGSFAGGLCEFRDRKCIYSRVFRNALWRKESNSLEDRNIAPIE